MKRLTSRKFLHNSQVGQLKVNIRAGRDDRVPLLMCGGFGVPMEIFDDLLDLMPDATVIRFDPPGIGGSDNRYLPYRFGHLASALDSLLDSLGCGQVDVLGISWGGMLAQEFVIGYPQRVRKLILASTLTGMVSVPGSIPLAVLKNPGKWFLNKQFSKMASLVYGGVVRKNDWSRLARYLSIYPKGLMGYLGQVSAICGWTSIHRLHTIPQPVLLLYGKDDAVIPMVNARLLQKIIPDAQLIQMECGHLFPWTHRDLVCREISAFRS